MSRVAAQSPWFDPMLVQTAMRGLRQPEALRNPPLLPRRRAKRPTIRPCLCPEESEPAMTAQTTPADMPELPRPYVPRDEQNPHDFYTAEQMAAMYEAGRAAAIEEAASECEALASCEGIAQRCAEAIRALAQKGGKP